ncbi:MAG: hypothetical protein JW727_00410 [Candidatus Aenigmarchaeota archaeon]|nr:hypothetical protein [Candidatus Aenigmarchaeota archaeon]
MSKTASKKSGDILYCGDGDLTTAARFPAAIMTYYGLSFDHVPSNVEVTEDQFDGRKLVVLSDFPARLMDDRTQKALGKEIYGGVGLAVFGGWNSGSYGGWKDSLIGDLLPVEMLEGDDRLNSSQKAVVLKPEGKEHPIYEGIDWKRPPCVGGFNKFTAKPGSEVLLNVVDTITTYEKGNLSIKEYGPRYPFLVLSSYGKGNIGVVATDISPHWGGVDYEQRLSEGRLKITAEGAREAELGFGHAQFFGNVLKWTGRY